MSIAMLMIAMLMLPLVVIGLALVLSLKPLINHGDTEKYKESIVALDASSKVEEKFYLGITSVDSVQMYKYMIKEKDGAISMKVAPASESKIYYTEDSEPYVEIEKENVYGKIISDYKFYLPEDSLRENIEINLED